MFFFLFSNFSNYFLFFKMSKIGIIVFLAFYLSVSGFNFLFFKWAGEKFVKAARRDVTAMDVLFIFLLNAPIMFFIEVFPPKGAITRLLSRIHRGHDTVMIGLLCILSSLAHQYLMKGPGSVEGWFFGFFIISEILFFALHATEEVSYDVARVLAIHLGGYTAIDLNIGAYSSAIACGITCSVCWIVMVFRLGGLRSPHTE